MFKNCREYDDRFKCTMVPPHPTPRAACRRRKQKLVYQGPCLALVNSVLITRNVLWHGPVIPYDCFF